MCVNVRVSNIPTDGGAAGSEAAVEGGAAEPAQDLPNDDLTV